MILRVYVGWGDGTNIDLDAANVLNAHFGMMRIESTNDDRVSYFSTIWDITVQCLAANVSQNWGTPSNPLCSPQKWSGHVLGTGTNFSQ